MKVASKYVLGMCTLTKRVGAPLGGASPIASTFVYQHVYVRFVFRQKFAARPVNVSPLSFVKNVVLLYFLQTLGVITVCNDYFANACGADIAILGGIFCYKMYTLQSVLDRVGDSMYRLFS